MSKTVLTSGGTKVITLKKSKVNIAIGITIGGNKKKIKDMVGDA